MSAAFGSSVRDGAPCGDFKDFKRRRENGSAAHPSSLRLRYASKLGERGPVLGVARFGELRFHDAGMQHLPVAVAHDPLGRLVVASMHDRRVPTHVVGNSYLSQAVSTA